MALVWMDGFESYGSVGSIPYTNLNKAWQDAQNTTVNLVSGRTGGLALQMGASGVNGSITTPIVANDPTIVVGLAFYQPSALGNVSLVQIYNGNSVKVRMEVNTDGSLSLEAPNTGAVFPLSTATGVVAADNWYFVELKVFFDTTVGTYEIRVNGANVLSGSGDTRTSTIPANWERIDINTRGGAGSNSMYIDDLYILDGTGGALDDFLGDVRIMAFHPTADGSQTDFDPDSGSTNYNASYVDGDSGDLDLYDYAPTGLGTTTHALQIITEAQKTDTNYLSLINRRGGTPYTAQTLASNSRQYRNIIPAPGSIASDEFGFEVD